MKRISFYFIRNYKFDLLTALFALISYCTSFRFTKDPKMLLAVSTLITLISVFAIVLLRLREKDFYFIPLMSRQDKDDWIGRGTFEYKRIYKSYLITDSEPGFIYSRCLDWNDYRFEFEFKIINSCLGAIIRAVDLSNYVMFQIRIDGIRPHIRVNGGWKPWEHAEAGLTFEEKLSLDEWYKCSLSCEKDLVEIEIKSNEGMVFKRSWSIPHERLGFPFPQEPNDQKPTVIHFPIDLDYGTCGFRNSGAEKALIKNVLVEKISYGKS